MKINETRNGNKEIKSGENTALHFAARNVNVSSEFIDQLKLADTRIRNANGDTPFHVAAKSSNPQTIINMLKTFAPSKEGWDIDDVEPVSYTHLTLPTIYSV